RRRHTRSTRDWSSDVCSSDLFGLFFNVGNRLVTALGHDIRCPEFPGKLLPRRVTAHRNDPASAHLFGGEDTEQPDRTVTDDRDCRTRLDVRSNGGEPAWPHYVGNRQAARNEVSGRN